MKQAREKRGTGTPRTHGMSHTRTYRAWTEMLRRCYSEHRKEYARYGGRGITVCQQWHDFAVFLADMGECPPNLTLERKDSNGNYEPLNCKWATQIEQQNNRTNNVRVAINGTTLTVAEWSRLNGVRPRTAAQRIRAGIDPIVSVSAPPNKGRKLCVSLG